jgi:two-component system, OmpR family, response regulator
MRVLIIEDEHRIANTIKKGLEQEHYVADVAYDGETGFDLASSEDFDVIILDVMLPKMDGFEVCQKLREEGIHTPILMLTAKGQTQDKVDGLNTGADDYLTKPFSFEELVARIRALSRRANHIVDTTLIVDDLELNTQTFEVKRDGELIPLSSKEFALLEYLMRNAKKVLKKEQIINHVWNYDADILPNTVEVYIRNLRRKIDIPFQDKKPLLQTARGFGYKIGN